jgi:hypothetical protein
MADSLVSKLGKTNGDICKLDSWEGGKFQMYLDVVHGLGICTSLPSFDISYLYDYPQSEE